MKKKTWLNFLALAAALGLATPSAIWSQTRAIAVASTTKA